MTSRKHNFLSDDIITTTSSKKTKRSDDTTTKNDSASSFTRRSTRSKNFNIFDAIAFVRETISAKVQEKKISMQKVITKVLISMKNQRDVDHERVIFLNNLIKKSVLALYCNIEKAESMSYL